MTSYFDHFMVTQMSSYISDGLMMLLSVFLLYLGLTSFFWMIPTRFQVVLEMVMSHWKTVVEENLGENSKYYLLPLSSLFMFIFGINLLGFFTYTFPATTHIFMTFGMAFIMWMSVMVFGFVNFKTSFFSMFMPSGAPLGMSPLLMMIEMASNISSPIALGMSLAANLTAGHMLMAMLSDFGSKLLFMTYGFAVLFPVSIMMFMTVLEVGVLVMQAYVFCLLSMIYLSDSIMLH